MHVVAVVAEVPRDALLQIATERRLVFVRFDLLAAIANYQRRIGQEGAFDKQEQIFLLLTFENVNVSITLHIHHASPLLPPM